MSIIQEPESDSALNYVSTCHTQPVPEQDKPGTEAVSYRLEPESDMGLHYVIQVHNIFRNFRYLQLHCRDSLQEAFYHHMYIHVHTCCLWS